MSRRRCLLSLLTVLAVLLAGGHSAERPSLSQKDLAQFKTIAEGIRRASSVSLYEGLPHQFWEPEMLKKELAAKKTVQIHGFPFYETPLTLHASEIEPLRRISATGESFRTYGGVKGCGGYHPDYCLAWTDGKATYHLLICFGCQEMKLHGPKSELLVDIGGEAYATFKAALLKYRKERPKLDPTLSPKNVPGL